MKRIHSVLVSLVFILGIFCCIFYLSCKKKCGSTVCQNGGTCDASVCTCAVGYSGNACQTGWSDQFIGTYLCHNSQCKPAIVGTGTWTSSVTKDANNSGYTVDISDFDGAGQVTVSAIVDSIGDISISPASGTAGTHATGRFSNDTITLDFTTSGTSGTTFSCTMVMVKQG